AGDVGGKFHLGLVQKAHAASTQPTKEEAHFKNHVLTTARLVRTPRRAAFVVAGKHHHRVAHVRVAFKLLDQSQSGIGLLGQDRRLEAQPLKDTGDLVAFRGCMSMNHENALAPCSWLLGGPDVDRSTIGVDREPGLYRLQLPNVRGNLVLPKLQFSRWIVVVGDSEAVATVLRDNEIIAEA